MRDASAPAATTYADACFVPSGFVSARFYQMEVDAHVKEPGKSLQA
ncbi:hypothetical protein [Burkholderia anthina]|nr:hypothetical protein [Burkholderia anthina]